MSLRELSIQRTMNAVRKILVASIAALVILGLTLLVITRRPSSSRTPVRFTLDWKFEGPAAGFLLAKDRGYYAAEGLKVTIDAGTGSTEGIHRVASGTYDLGFADINTLIRFRDKNPTIPLKAVMMLYDVPAFAIITLEGSGIEGPRDLEGKTLGAPASDAAFAQWKAFAAVNHIDTSKVKIENIGFALREPMLREGRVDAITGFSFSSYFNLRSAGVPSDKIRILRMADYGLVLYGNAIIANPRFADEHPEAVRGFIRATIRGFRDAIRDPSTAIESVLSRNDVARRDIELARFEMALEENILTPWVKEHGVGDVDRRRLEQAIDQIGYSYTFTHKPKPEDVFTDTFLPPQNERMLM